MMKQRKIWVLSGLLFITACVTVPDEVPVDFRELHGTTFSLFQELKWIWESHPVNNHPAFIAVAPRMYDRERERQECLLYAATQVSIFNYIIAETAFYSRQDGTVWNSGNISSLQVEYDQENLAQIADNLTIVREFRDADGTYMLVVDETVVLPPVNFVNTYTAGKPDWIKQLPQIDGYNVSLGISEPYRLMADSIRNADKNALVDLLKGVSVRVMSENLQVTKNTTGQGASRSLEISTGVLKGFYILSRWTADGVFYSLAVCPEN